MARSTRPRGTFPYLDAPEWRARLVDAAHNDSRCRLDPEAAAALSLEALDLRTLIHASDRGRVVHGFQDSVVTHEDTTAGRVWFLNVVSPGTAGAINPFNIRFGHDLARSQQPHIVPRWIDDAGRPLAVLEATFADEAAFNAYIDWVDNRLAGSERARPYDLRATLRAQGQAEPATYHALRLVIGGETRTVWVATAGTHRTKSRHSLFGLESAAGLLGPHTAGLPGRRDDGRISDPAVWRDLTAEALNTAEAEADDTGGDEPTEHWAVAAADAKQVARVRSRYVIGFEPNPGGMFESALTATNLGTHLWGPLQLRTENTALVNGQQLLDTLNAKGHLTDLERDVLRRARPVTDLAAGTPAEIGVALCRLVDQIVYPTHPDAQKVVAATLVEPSRSRLLVRHADQRAEIRAALLTLAVGGIDLPAAALDKMSTQTIKSGRTPGGDLAELLARSGAEVDTEDRRMARAELGHLAAPGLAHTRVFLGGYGSTGDRRSPNDRLMAAAATRRGAALFEAAIDAFGSVVAARAGIEVLVTSEIQKLDETGAPDLTMPEAERRADAAWFAATFGKGEVGDRGDRSPAQETATERFARLQGSLPRRVGAVEVTLKALHEDTTLMVAAHGPSRGLSSEERLELIDKMTAIAEQVEQVETHIKKLKWQEAPVDNGGRDPDGKFGTEGIGDSTDDGTVPADQFIFPQ